MDIKRFQDFLIKETLFNVEIENVLKTLKAQKVDFYNSLELDREDYENNTDLETLINSKEFNNSLSSIGYKHGGIEKTDEYETLLDTPIKFIFIYKIESILLENPVFIAYQKWNSEIKKWLPIICYKFDVNTNINLFYDKISTSFINLKHEDDEYLYKSNNNNEWILQNPNSKKTYYKKVYRTEELKKLLEK